MALSDLDSNRYDKIIRFKNSTAISCPAPHSTTDTGDKSSIGTRVSENGEIEVLSVRKPQKQLSDSEAKQIIVDYQNGKTTYELAEQYDCHRITISHHLKKHGIRVTLASTQIADNIPHIVALYDSGLKISEIARKYDVSEATVQKYLHIGGARIRSRWDYPGIK